MSGPETLAAQPTENTLPLPGSYRLLQRGENVIRHNNSDILDEYTPDGIYGPSVLDFLGVKEGDVKGQLLALAAASKAELDKTATSSTEEGFSIVPHSYQIGFDQKGNNALVMTSQKVEPAEATNAQRLSYLPSILAYHSAAFTDFLAIIDTGAENRPFHTDVVKPSQYMFGSINQAPAELYMVDIDPEITTVANPDGSGGMFLSPHFIQSVIDMATMANLYQKDVSETFVVGLNQLIDTMVDEGVLSEGQHRMLLAAQKDGSNPSNDGQIFNLT